MNHNTYASPLTDRYAGAEMSYVWSPQFKHSTWRRLWLELAKCEQKLGLEITDSQIRQMSEHLDDIDFDRVAEKEKELRHDVMSHIHVFGECCPVAMPIIHLGATSCFVTDNTELIQMREGMKILRGKLLKLMAQMADFCEKNRELPTLGFTHYQPAQLTTVGKRFCLYLQDFMLDFERLEREIEELPFRSVKGTTGTQASFLELFDGDHAKCRQLEKDVAAAMGFDHVIAVSGQTYTRKIDYFVMSILSGIAQSAAKMATDIRLLANLKEVEEPFGKKQIGSSAMAYKRNPMRCERVCSLARYVMNLPGNAAMTEATQWFERTLDDSANRRILLGEGFLTVDIILSLLINITDGTLADLNRIMQWLFANRGSVAVLHTGTMQIRFLFRFSLLPYEQALLTRDDVPPKPAGVGYDVYAVPKDTFGFFGSGLMPFGQGAFVNGGAVNAYSL